MEPSDEAVEYLAEIRDIQREYLEEYRRVTARSLEIQEIVLRNQAAAIRRQKLAFAILGLMVFLLIAFLFSR